MIQDSRTRQERAVARDTDSSLGLYQARSTNIPANNRVLGFPYPYRSVETSS